MDEDPAGACDNAAGAADPTAVGEEVQFQCIFGKRKIEMSMATSDTVGRLKQKLEGLTEIPSSMQKLVWKGVLKDLVESPLQLHAWDYDFGSKDDPLGYASVPLDQLENVKTFHHGADLSEKGTVFLRFAWQADGDAAPPASFKEVHTGGGAPPLPAPSMGGYGREQHMPPPEFAPPPPSGGGGYGQAAHQGGGYGQAAHQGGAWP